MQDRSAWPSQAPHLPAHQQGGRNSVWDTDILFTPKTLQFIPVILKHLISDKTEKGTFMPQRNSRNDDDNCFKSAAALLFFITFTGFIDSHKHLPKSNIPKRKLSCVQ